MAAGARQSDLLEEISDEEVKIFFGYKRLHLKEREREGWAFKKRSEGKLTCIATKASERFKRQRVYFLRPAYRASTSVW